MDKQSLVDQLSARLREAAHAAHRAADAASQEARDGATPAEKREDARVAIEQGSLAKGQARREERVRAELSALDAFRPKALPSSAPVALGAVVEVEDEECGRTFFLAPVGAGMELTGPGGDGFLSVVTPVSPLGRAVMGKKRGDTVEVTVEGELREWTITWVG
jgi:transcription elongation GreA/GreB family factor